jgi:hypothetical protein
MKILLISNQFPPDISPRAFRWGTITEVLADEGHQVDIVCGWRYNIPNEETLGNIKVYRVGEFPLEKLRHWIHSSHNSFPKSNTKSNKYQGLKLDTIIRKIHDFTWKKIYWPDYACLWYYPAIRKARELCKRQTYDAVISVSLPFTAHLVGLSLKHCHPTAKWVLDIGDPFCFSEAHSNNQRIFSYFNYKAEEAVFRSADHICVTIEKCRERYAKIFPRESSKIIVIPPVSRLAIQEHHEPRRIFKEKKLILLYAGNLYRGIRNPNPLLDILRALLNNRPELTHKMELHFFGDCKQFQESFDNFCKQYNILHLHGIVPPAFVKLAEMEADVLINIGNQTNYQLPSKVVEYAGTGKPILNISTIEDDSSALFLKNYPLACQITLHGEIINNEKILAVSRFLDDSFGKTVPLELLEKFLEPYDAKKLAFQYLDLFQQ